MNILVLHSSSDLYGASKILLQTIAYLSQKGHKIIVVLSEEGPLADLIRKEGIDVHIIKLGVLRRKYFTPSGLVNRVASMRKAQKEIKKIAGNHHIDVVYSNTTSILAGAFFARKANVKHIWHIHEIITQRWLLKILGWVVNRYSDRVIVVSKAVKEHWQNYIDESKIAVIYNGLDYDKYLIADGKSIRKELGLSSDTILIGMIGRVHPWKGQTYFLNIAKHVLDVHSDIRFVMVGDVYSGNEYLYDEIKKTKQDLGLQDKVMDLGYRTDIPQILSAMDIFVLPSILPDPLPTVVLEAMAAGKPVVATAHGGSVEMVQSGITGFLVPWDNSLKAAEAILKLTENQSLRETMSKNALKRVQISFSSSAYFKNIEQIFFGELSKQKNKSLLHYQIMN